MHFINTAKICRGMENYGDFPTEKEIVKSTIHIAWPSVLESFAINLAGMVDMVMVGKLGTASIAAVSLTNQPKFLVLAPFLALNVATASIVARRKGEENQESAIRLLKMVLAITVVLTLVMTVLAVIFAENILLMVGAKEDTIGSAVDYFKIIMFGNIFNTIQLVINGAQKGIGNMRIPMATNIIANVINVILNYLLIEGHFGFPAWGVKGAAIATVVGTVFSCILSIVSVLRRDSYLNMKVIKGWVADKLSRDSFVKVGVSTLAEQLCIRIGFMLFAITVANLGTIEVAAHQIGMNMMSLSFSIGDGLSAAAVTLIGQSLGAKRPDMAKIFGSVCQRIGLCCAAVISIVYSLFGRQIYSIVDSSPQVLDYGVTIMRILSIILFLQIEQVVQFGCLRGAGDTKFTALVSLISITLIRPGMAALFVYPLGMGLIGAWIGTTLDQIVRFILSYVRFKKGKWIGLKL